MEPLQNTLAGLDYTKCSTDELKKFFAQRKSSRRTLPPPSARYQLIWELERLDCAATFRFEDMAPELRLHVYEELFDLSPNMARKPNTQILRSCKMVYREGKPILDQIMNGITLVRIKALSTVARPGVTSVQINRDLPLPEPRLDRPLHEHLSRWPASLEGEENVLIQITLPEFSMYHPQGLDYLSSQLYLLATRLGPSKTRKVVVHIRNANPTFLLDFFLWPLSRLATNANLVISGVSQEFERTFREEHMSIDIVPTVLRSCVQQRDALSKLEEELSGKGVSKSVMLTKLQPRLALIMSEFDMIGVWCNSYEQRLSYNLLEFRQDFAEARREALGSESSQ